MLRIFQNRSADSAKSYYTHADYYGEGVEKAGVWRGKAAALLGLSGQIEKADFDALCENRDPRTGEQLTARHNADRTVLYDFNWHVPKAVSLAYALGGDERIATAFEEAVQQTMEEIEAEAQTRVRTHGRQENRTTGNFVWGHFTHLTTRPDEHGIPDPHLHAHCTVFNVTHDPVEQRFKAGQFRELKRDAPWFEARMHARLARSLRRLGYSIQRDGRHWDIAGVPTAVKREFCRRTHEIERLAEARGITNPEQKAELGSLTRRSKSEHQTLSELQSIWQQRLPDDQQNLFEDLRDRAGPGTVNGPQSTSDAVKLAVQHVFEREAIVPERKLLTEALRFGVGTIDETVLEQVATRQGVIVRDLAGRSMATTEEALHDEATVLDFARNSRHSVRPLNAAWAPQDDWLSLEQTDAIHALTHSHDRLQLLLGGAGTGKTTLMQAAVAAIEAGGHQVFTFAPSSEASRRVLREEGFAAATTVAELLVNPELQQQTRHSVIWIDEASLLGSRQLKQVVDLAEKNDCRLILSGDWVRQHGSVERGGLLNLIDRYTPVTPIQIQTIRRQQGDYRDAVAALARGDVESGFQQLDALGWIKELDDDERDRAIAERYADIVEKKQSALVVSPTHREADRITQQIRTTLKERKLIGEHETTVSILKPRHLTEGQRSDPAMLNAGDVLVFHQNAKGFRKGTRVTVGETISQQVLSQARHYSVYRPDEIQLAVGDQIRLTAGGKTQDGKHRLNNGATFEIQSINEDGDLTLQNGWVIDHRFGHVSHGVVNTSFASQGRTVDHVLIAESADSLPAASSQQFYTSASRGRRSVQIWTDSKADLLEAVRESSQQTTATEVFNPLQRDCLHRRQQQAATQTLSQSRERELVYDS